MTTEMSEKIESMKAYFARMEFTVQSLGFIAGSGMLILGGFGALSNIFALSPIELVLNVFLAIFGLTMCMLEFKNQLMVDQFRIFIEREIHILYTPYGRASFYVLAGVMLVANKGGFLSSCLGLFCIGVGALSSVSAKQASDTLSRLLDEQYTAADIEAKFKKFDRDRSGALDPKEVKAMCTDLSATLTEAQLEAVVFALDKNRDGLITKDEFMAWWKTNKDKNGLLDSLMSFIPFV